MTSKLKELQPHNILALGVVGFSGAFAFSLLRDLFAKSGGLEAAGINLVASVLLIIVCAITWPSILSPTSARVSWQAGLLVLIACVLALVARMPALQAQ